MLGLPYRIDQIAPLAEARDLFQGEFSPRPLRYVAFDTRMISHGPETLFVALKTDNRDGHAFITKALEKGVRNFLVDRRLSYPGINYILTENTLSALQFWAMYHRSRFDYPVIAITGSNGKTIVKEWLATLLEMQFQIVKSPMSYNSQLGVALSLLQMHPQADLAIIEAGISLPGEMEVLRTMIQPTLGILTHMGPAHAEGFASDREKLIEKLSLFEEVETVLVGEQPTVLQQLNESSLPFKTTADEPVLKHLKLPFQGAADVENGRLSVLAARHLGLSQEEIQERLPLLHPIEMRLEIITDNPDITIINDSYNSDPDSVRNALQLLAETQAQPRQFVVLSDIPHLGENQLSVQKELLKEAVAQVGEEQVITIGPVFGQLQHPWHFEATEALLAERKEEDFRHSTVLLKGARNFQLERLIPLLNPRRNASWLEIDLALLAENFRYLKSQLPEGTKTMCMVKATSYGGGTWEIAQVLEREGATYLGVAYASEGIELRKAGIRLPIMVMNPDGSSLDALLRYEIEPEISNLDFLQRYIRAARLAGLPEYRVHLKLETGMGRLGFRAEELKELISLIQQYPDLNIISVLTHLAAADVPEEDAFTHGQVGQFQQMYQVLQGELGLQSFRHVLNTSGVQRFPEYGFEMVRLGIGLYGLAPGTETGDKLQEIGSLFTSITQIKTWTKGTSIGYGRSQFTRRETRIATLPIGYADGIPRNLSNGKMAFWVRGKAAPIFGRVCMDMLMLDVTDIPEAEAGDTVLCFGRSDGVFQSVERVAEAAETIPYEIMVRISPRVRRVFVR